MPYRPVELDPPEVLRLAETARGHGLDAQLASYLLVRVPVPVDEQVRLWTGWVVVTALSAFTSLAVVAIIVARRRLRMSVYNHFIIGLAVPDIVFSFLCLLTCSKHVLLGRWYDGEGFFQGGWMCDFQSWYTLFGAAGSMWVNVLITFELYRVTSSTQRRKTCAPLTTQCAYTQLGIVYVAVAAFAWLASFGYRFFPGLPMRPSAINGINCLPIPYDEKSETVLISILLTATAFLPIVIVLAFAASILRPKLCSRNLEDPPLQTRKARSSSLGDERGSQSPCSRRRRLQSTSISSNDHLAHSHRLDDETSAPGLRKIEKLTTRALTLFFSRLFIVMVVCWAPFFIGWAIRWPSSEMGAWMTWVTGGWGHLQGLFSAIMYSMKDDLYAEWRLVATEVGVAFGCRSRPLEGSRSRRRRGIARLSAEAIARRTAGSAGSADAHAHYAMLIEDGCADVQDGPAAASQPHAEADLEAGGGAVADSGPAHHGDDLEKAIAEIAAEAEANILAREKTPMLVVSWLAWQLVGEIPRHSREVWRERKPTDVVIFISHRWWLSHLQLPDDEVNTKYHLIVQGVRQLIAEHGVSEEHAAIWCDFACISQDDQEEQALGIASLITYAARSSYVLIPVEPTVEAMEALHHSTHPIDLIGFGERAWCRCEIYVFMCLAEVTRRSVAVFAYGDLDIGQVVLVENERHAKAMSDGVGQCSSTSTLGLGLARLSGSRSFRGISRRRLGMKRDGLQTPLGGCLLCAAFMRGLLGCVANGMTDSLHAFGLASALPRKQLKALVATGNKFARTSGAHGVHFSSDELPSSGEVTLEADRATIHAIEADVRSWFVHASVLAEKARLDNTRNCSFMLEGKQLEAQHLPLLASVLLSSQRVDALSRISLRHNLLTDESIEAVMGIVLADRMKSLRELDLSGNVNLSSSGLAALAVASSHPNFRLRTLRLRDCELSAEAGASLACLVTAAAMLNELDLRDNQLDDETVLSVVGAADEKEHTTGSHTRLHVGGNPISAHVLQLTTLAQMQAAGIVSTIAEEPSTNELHVSFAASRSRDQQRMPQGEGPACGNDVGNVAHSGRTSPHSGLRCASDSEPAHVDEKGSLLLDAASLGSDAAAASLAEEQHGALEDGAAAQSTLDGGAESTPRGRSGEHLARNDDDAGGRPSSSPSPPTFGVSFRQQSDGQELFIEMV